MGLFDKLFGRSSTGNNTSGGKRANEAQKNYEDARAYEIGEGVELNPKKAVELYRKAAEAGHEDAAYHLGVLLSVLDAKDNDTEKWVRIAAMKGEHHAQYKLGCILYESKGASEALQWFTKASENGNGSASSVAGAIYMESAQNDTDKEKAKKLFIRAWEQGDKHAIEYIAKCCYSLKQYDEAFSWAEKGAEQDNPNSYYMLANLHKDSLCTKSGGIGEAVVCFDKASKLGHANASYWLGQYYRGENGGEVDSDKSSEYMTEAAKHGHPDAQYDMAVYGLEHLGPECREASISLLKAAANKDHPEACYLLGTFYLNGTGVEVDYHKAMKYFSISRDKKVPMAQLELAMMLVRGQGVEPNPRKGIEFLEPLATDKTTFVKVRRKALLYLGKIYRMGYGVDEDYAKAVQYFAEAAELGDPDAMYEYATHYGKGDGIEQDYNKCVEWLEKAIENGNEKACYLLGVMNENGIGMEPEYGTAMIYYNAAADAGYPDALYRLYEIYHDGDMGEEADIEKAHDYLAKAIDAESPEAMCRMGLLFYTGDDGITQNYAKAKAWFEKAADEDSGEAFYWLGIMYARGDGMTEDYAMSRRMSNMALELGFEDAQKTIDVLDENGV